MVDSLSTSFNEGLAYKAGYARRHHWCKDSLPCLEIISRSCDNRVVWRLWALLMSGGDGLCSVVEFLVLMLN